MDHIHSGDSRIERYLAHLDRLAGGIEPKFWPVESTKPGVKGVTAIGYPDVPETGYLIGFTYGLSLAENELWARGKPELCIGVRSEDPRWVLAMATMAEDLRGECPFQYGDTLNFGQPISPDSDMDGFLAFAPAVVSRDDSRIEVGDDLPINLIGLYPTYRSERRFVREQGLGAFMKLDWDASDVTRPPVA